MQFIAIGLLALASLLDRANACCWVPGVLRHLAESLQQNLSRGCGEVRGGLWS
jgi:hypothetical protein